jgi:hypothetical protein
VAGFDLDLAQDEGHGSLDSSAFALTAGAAQQ